MITAAPRRVFKAFLADPMAMGALKSLLSMDAAVLLFHFFHTGVIVRVSFRATAAHASNIALSRTRRTPSRQRLRLGCKGLRRLKYFTMVGVLVTSRMRRLRIHGSWRWRRALESLRQRRKVVGGTSYREQRTGVLGSP